MKDNSKKLYLIIDMLQGIPKHQWDALVIEVNREYERNASKVMLTDVSGLKKLFANKQKGKAMNCGKTYRMRGYAMVPIDITIPLNEGQDPDDVADNFDDSDYAEFILGSAIPYIIRAEIDEIEEVV